MKINSINSVNLNTFNSKTNSYQQKPSFNNTFAFSKTSSQALKNQILFGAKRRRSDNPNINNFCQDYEGNIVNVKVEDFERSVARCEDNSPFSGIMTTFDNGQPVSAVFENGLIQSSWKNGKLYKNYSEFEIKTPDSLIQGATDKPYGIYGSLEIVTPDNQHINKLSRQQALKITEFDEEGNVVSTTVESYYLNGAKRRIWNSTKDGASAVDYSPSGAVISKMSYDEKNKLKYAEMFDEKGTLRKRIYRVRDEYTQETYAADGILRKAKVGGKFNNEFPEIAQGYKLNMENPNTVELFGAQGELTHLIRVVNKNRYTDDLYATDVRNGREVVLKNILYRSSYPREILKEPQIVTFNFDEAKPDKQVVFFDDTSIMGDEIYSDELEQIIRILEVASKSIREDDLDISKEQVDSFIEQLGKNFQIRHYKA